MRNECTGAVAWLALGTLLPASSPVLASRPLPGEAWLPAGGWPAPLQALEQAQRSRPDAAARRNTFTLKQTPPVTRKRLLSGSR